MKIAIASGKGGTGKTTLATNLVRVISGTGRSVAYLDCDVEEPNGHIFLKPVISETKAVGVLVPKVDESKCTNCGKCSDICQYSAIVAIKDKIMVFPELCHGCGGCSMVCAPGAITEVLFETGKVETGIAGPIKFTHGLLNVGQVMSPPVIKGVKQFADSADVVFFDAPPGTSCPVIEAIRDCDYVVLVTEPTPFGLHDLKLAVEMVRALKLPFGVVINRADAGDDKVAEFCAESNIECLVEIPDDRRVAEAYSRGEMITDVFEDYRRIFLKLAEKITDRVGAQS